ncbi:hypothetical protein CLOSTASPAR_02514 [[Clostridium] asparagiforme DSM 15981]|uniref:Uncharacterized protein n=1 Tax=[Clostridium] asparagiforme DSM 15981 TaxID=518636 RepID=C0CZT7_9FIRM|nr:hypothetical protein CLOSTASPAR_02514 [[Clostridium] asparagiforme DSM 15981]
MWIEILPASSAMRKRLGHSLRRPRGLKLTELLQDRTHLRRGLRRLCRLEYTGGWLIY